MFIYLISWSPCNANYNDVDDDDDGGYDGDDGGGYDGDGYDGDGYDGDDGGGGDHLDLSQSDRHGDDAEPEVGQGKVEDQKIPKQQMLLFFYLRSWRNPWEKEIEDEKMSEQQMFFMSKAPEEIPSCGFSYKIRLKIRRFLNVKWFF